VINHRGWRAFRDLQRPYSPVSWGWSCGIRRSFVSRFAIIRFGFPSPSSPTGMRSPTLCGTMVI